MTHKAAFIVAAMIASPGAAAAVETTTTVSRDAFVCLNWAAWHEYGMASLTPRGARITKLCPRRLAKGTPVTVIDDDYGEGASEIRYHGTTWFIDNEKLK